MNRGFYACAGPSLQGYNYRTINHDLPALEATIEQHFTDRAQITPETASPELCQAVETTLDLLEAGTARVAEPTGSGWQVNEWLKKAVLLSFRIHADILRDGGETRYFDRVASQFASHGEEQFQATGFRVVPPATVRRGAHIARGVVLMPSFVNIGGFVGAGTMVDTWATVGSCAQIGANVHLSGGVGIGGVLEPLQANPTIIEDNCFIGARSEVVEGVVVGANSVLSMGVFISQSTKIYDRATGTVTYGKVPPGSVVVPGSLPAADGSHSLACAVIVKQVDATTRSKTGINELLRTG